MGRQLELLINGVRRTVSIIAEERNRVRFELEGRTFDVAFELPLPTGRSPVQNAAKRVTRSRATASPGDIRAPIPGLVAEVCVAPGDHVTTGTVLLKLEAMKMQNNIIAGLSGIVEAVHVKSGEEVTDHQPLVAIKAD